MKKNFITEIISAAFILLFVYTGLAKWMSFNTLKHVLRNYPLIGNYATYFALILPGVELIIAALLFIFRTRLIGLFAAMIIMVLFTGYLSYMLISTPHLPCTCGGMLQKLSWPNHLIFNITSIILAIVAILLSKNKKKYMEGLRSS